MFDLSPMTLAHNALFLIPMLLSLTVHEWAHAWSAMRLGDDTAAREGRLTLDPLAHIDPLGTFLLPILGVPFGWAKPVPVNPVRFDRKWSMRTGMALTAAAGPISNLLLAVLCGLLLGLGRRFAPEFVDQPGVWTLLTYGVMLNVSLALFNFLPVPPLDGSRVVARYIPARYEAQWETFVMYSPYLLFAVIAVGGRLLSGPIYQLSSAIYALTDVFVAHR